MGSVMKRLAVIGLGVLVVLAGAEIGLRATPRLIPDLWYWPTPESQLKYGHLMEEGRDPSVVLLGSSFLEAAFDPDLDDSDLEIYNLAMPFSSITTMQVWLDEVVSRSTDPLVIVIGIPVWSEGTRIGISGALVEAIRRTEDNGANEMQLWNLRGSLGMLDRSLARERLTRTNFWTESGHQTGYRNRVDDRSQWRPRGQASMESTDRAELARLLTMAKRSADHVVILIEPLAESVAPPAPMVERYVGEVMEVAAENGVEVWEVPPEFWDDANFVDGVHFDAGATDTFSDYLGRRLVVTLGDS
jgi:hypothetical protein